MLQAWHTCFETVCPNLLCTTSQAPTVWMGSVSTQPFSDLSRVLAGLVSQKHSQSGPEATFVILDWGKGSFSNRKRSRLRWCKLSSRTPTSLLSAFLSVIGKAVTIFVHVIYMQEFQSNFFHFVIILYYDICVQNFKVKSWFLPAPI